MENEKKEDLLLELTESEDEIYEKEEIDNYIEKKILDYIQNEKPSLKSRNKTFRLIATCFFMFLSSSILIVLLPIYIKYSSVTRISTYSKLVILSLVNAVLFIVTHVVGVLLKCGNRTVTYSLSLGDILKISLLFSFANIIIFCLIDGNIVSCHLIDPLKGSSVAFSLLFYFVFSRKKMSLEKTFCVITVIVGVFISVDFGMCDKFQCNGNSNLTEIMSKLHFLYVIFYILAHGLWVLPLTLTEVCWTISKFQECNSNLNVSVLSKVWSDSNSGTEHMKTSIQSLSLICQEEEEEQLTLKKENFSNLSVKKNSYFHSKPQIDKSNSGKASENSINNSMLNRNQFSVPDFLKFPLTSTPNNESNSWYSWASGKYYDVALWQNLTFCLIVLGLCWFPTLPVFDNGKSKLLADVLSEVIDSFSVHLHWEGKYNYLPTITILVSVSYVVLMLTSIEVLKITHSAVTVVSVMMAALPVTSLFWSLFRINEGATNILEFSPEITGEAVCAVLGFPIIGIGIVLLIKSHVREFFLMI